MEELPESQPIGCAENNQLAYMAASWRHELEQLNDAVQFLEWNLPKPEVPNKPERTSSLTRKRP